jgi:hypothetical protein
LSDQYQGKYRFEKKGTEEPGWSRMFGDKPAIQEKNLAKNSRFEAVSCAGLIVDISLPFGSEVDFLNTRTSGKLTRKYESVVRDQLVVTDSNDIAGSPNLQIR